MYKTLKYKVGHEFFYFDIRIDENTLNNISRNYVEYIFSKLKTMDMKFGFDANGIIFVGPFMKIDECNIIENITSMTFRQPNA